MWMVPKDNRKSPILKELPEGTETDLRKRSPSILAILEQSPLYEKMFWGQTCPKKGSYILVLLGLDCDPLLDVVVVIEEYAHRIHDKKLSVFVGVVLDFDCPVLTVCHLTIIYQLF